MATLEERIALRELELKIEENEQKTTAGGAFGTRMSVEFGDNMLGWPQFIGRTPAFLAAGVQGLVGSRGDPGVLGGGDFDFQRRLEQQDRPLLAEAAFNTPRPEVSDVAGAVGALKQNPETGAAFGDRFDEEKLAFEQEQLALQEQFPKASLAGEVIGDVATLLTGRSGVNAGKRMRDIEMAVKRKFGPADMAFGNVPLPGKGYKAVFEAMKKSKPVESLIRGAGRSAETGLEAMALDVLHGDDPLETAAYAAAGQATGSAFLIGLKATFAGNLGTAALNVGAASFAAGSLWQIVKDMTPGGRDSIIDSVETGYEKVMLALLLGSTAGLTGGGRIRGNLGKSGVLAENLPRWADAVSTVPRGITLSLLEELVNAQPEEQRNVETALQRMSVASGDLSKEILDELNNAMEKGTFAETVESLKNKKEEFRNWLDEE